MIYNYDDVVLAAKSAMNKFAKSGVFKSGGKGEAALIAGSNGDFSGIREIGISSWLNTARNNRDKGCAFEIASFIALLSIGPDGNGKDTSILKVEDYYLVDHYLSKK